LRLHIAKQIAHIELVQSGGEVLRESKETMSMLLSADFDLMVLVIHIIGL